jgi:hypothetical protein
MPDQSSVLLGACDAPLGASARVKATALSYTQPAMVKRISPHGLSLFGMAPCPEGTVVEIDLYLLDVKLPPGTLPAGKIPKFCGRVVAADDARFTMTIAYQALTDADRALAGEIASAIAAQSGAPAT